MDEERIEPIKESFLLSKTTKIIGIIALIVIIILAVGFGIFKTEQNKLFYSINNNISNLSSTISGFNRGLNNNEEFLNSSFATNYQKNFANVENSFKENSSNILNTNYSQSVIAKEVAKATYYNYITQVVQQAVSYKSDFTPLTNVLNKGGKLTNEEKMQMESDLTALENSSALTAAMNLYNEPNTGLSLSVTSPYSLKQSLINLNNAIANDSFSNSTIQETTSPFGNFTSMVFTNLL